MPRKPPMLADALDNQCAIVRSLGVLSDSWSFLLLREALLGRRTFAQFRDSLGIASDVLSARLNALVEHGVLERIPYQEPGQRTRDAYELTAAGDELKVVLVAMQQWGEAHVQRGRTGSVLPVRRGGHERVRAVLVDTHDVILGEDDVDFVRVTASEAPRR
ncbi:DNA-binding HxlR family transcriptional regulator [Microbacterium sp. W4I4]|uniref:winged helix-turn-helix transcriptional regulator n=1 Tax=Microbacterium sp. W4I4 TaxID=3042295 RepID=UPI002780DA03|nr:helix-turn-helix domain-containing protein [Microbacterium sp. W4I4]MDQ0613984.1 DNA-binding HxlR family transcriptional regulator [Microbacterium sp. W4I4]